MSKSMEKWPRSTHFWLGLFFVSHFFLGHLVSIRYTMILIFGEGMGRVLEKKSGSAQVPGPRKGLVPSVNGKPYVELLTSVS